MRPLARDQFVDVMAIDLTTASVTVSEADAVWPSSDADTVVAPSETPVASPSAPNKFEMVATAGALDSQVTWVVMSKVVLSENRPDAAK